MRRVHRAFFQMLFEVLERPPPFVRARSAIWQGALSRKSPLKQERHISGDAVQTKTYRGGSICMAAAFEP
jgi:hypothetical protein